MKSVVEAVLITAPLAALVTSFAEFKKQYNLYDLLADLFRAAIARTRAL